MRWNWLRTGLHPSMSENSTVERLDFDRRFAVRTLDDQQSVHWGVFSVLEFSRKKPSATKNQHTKKHHTHTNGLLRSSRDCCSFSRRCFSLRWRGSRGGSAVFHRCTSRGRGSSCFRRSDRCGGSACVCTDRGGGAELRGGEYCRTGGSARFGRPVRLRMVRKSSPIVTQCSLFFFKKKSSITLLSKRHAARCRAFATTATHDAGRQKFAVARARAGVLPTRRKSNPGRGNNSEFNGDAHFDSRDSRSRNGRPH